ncbi:SPW repeat domain-containing protein [Rubrolithibacter danxiaensis]|uniref:SPW repeat domain-containing protein n=1 Tax=Rubrolithibacter danxiaensis TaxID=3390805 RepID=UPI003BF7BB86
MWPRVINMLIGLWICMAPSVLKTDKVAADCLHIIGPVVFAVAVIAMSEAVRDIRLINILSGVCLLISPWILRVDSSLVSWNNSLAGILLILFSLIKGKVKNRFGGGWQSLFEKNPLHQQEAELHRK